MKKIKICYLLVSPYYGGVVTVVSSLVAGLDINKYEISVVYDSSFQKIDACLKKSNLFPVRLRRWYFILDLPKLFLFLRKNKFDILHSHNTKTHIIGILLAYLVGVPFKICTIHEDFIGMLGGGKKKKILTQTLYKIIFSLTDLIICVSNSTLEKNKIMFPNGKSCVIRNGYVEKPGFYSINELTTQEKISKNRIITYIGRITKEKGLHILIEAMNLIDFKEELKIQVIGGSYDDSYYAEIIKLITKYNLQNIHFYGVLKNFTDLLMQTDIVVVPSSIESMGYSILDAWNCKKAVIASNIDGIPEVITDGHDGLLFKNNDPSDLVKKICYLFQDNDYRILLGENGYHTLIENYSAVKFIQNMTDIYSSMGAEQI